MAYKNETIYRVIINGDYFSESRNADAVVRFLTRSRRFLSRFTTSWKESCSRSTDGMTTTMDFYINY